jgi:solute carrier family 6 amino acid/orphan transporter-like 15/16/17/18/20
VTPPSGVSRAVRTNAMESFQDFSDETEEESTRKLHTANSRNWSFKAKICAAKMTNNILNTKTTENILIQVAFSVWLDSIWRFPYLCHRNGGGKARGLRPDLRKKFKD